MFERRHLALDDNDYDDSGFDDAPVEIESEILQYEFDENEDSGGAETRPPAPVVPVAKATRPARPKPKKASAKPAKKKGAEKKPAAQKKATKKAEKKR